MEKSEVMKALKALDEMVDLTIEACKKDIMTKDGYGTMMVIVDKFKNNPVVQKNIILMCIAKGYPKQTGLEVMKIMGLE